MRLVRYLLLLARRCFRAPSSATIPARAPHQGDDLRYRRVGGAAWRRQFATELIMRQKTTPRGCSTPRRTSISGVRWCGHRRLVAGLRLSRRAPERPVCVHHQRIVSLQFVGQNDIGWCSARLYKPPHAASNTARRAAFSSWSAMTR